MKRFGSSIKSLFYTLRINDTHTCFLFLTVDLNKLPETKMMNKNQGS